MIKSIKFINEFGDELLIELSRPEDSGLAITSISGLGPGKATINMTERATSDGGSFNSSRIPTRNITISFRYYGIDIESIRQSTYKYFSLKKKIKMEIKTSNRTVEIEGFIESNEPDIFSENSGSTISILCPDPLFYSSGINGVVDTIFYGIEPFFEFPFSNESLTSKEVTFGEIRNRKENVVVYDGDSDVGIIININVLGPVSDITIYNTTKREKIVIDGSKVEKFTKKKIDSGDEIIICTIRGKKSVSLIRDGEHINILNCINKDADWFTLSKGDNIFAYTASSGSSNLQFSIKNRIAYEGI